MEEIHLFFLSFLSGLSPITIYPISIEYIFSCKLDERSDLDNYALPYYKGFQDCLVKSKIVENDTWKYISNFLVSHIDSDENILYVRLYANNSQTTT
jgi:hypothetical protein